MLFCRHDYGWPRRVDGADIQTCTRCGVERKSKIQFVEAGRKPFTCEASKTTAPAVVEITAVSSQAREFIGSGL
jgi:hypothetical protein